MTADQAKDETYRILRFYQDGAFDKTNVGAGQLTCPLTAALDKISPLLDSVEQTAVRAETRILQLLVEAGHVNTETVEKARHLASTLK